MEIGLKLIGSILTIAATFVITVVVFKIDNEITGLTDDVESIHLKSNRFLTITVKQQINTNLS